MIMKRIGLVASTNGLGHARRLLHLGLGFTELGFNPVLFASRRQLALLKSEINDFKNNSFFEFMEIAQHGIEGPAWASSGYEIRVPDQDVIHKIKNCNLIISDNVIWPFNYNQAFVLFGHFNWLNYWSQMGIKYFPPRTLDIFKEEVDLIEKIQIAFQFKSFTMGSERYAPKKILPMSLLRYQTDSLFPKSIGKNVTIWIAKGTTGLDQNILSERNLDKKIEFKELETYQLINSKSKPSIILGRPGLGTIRDCLASGTPFLPIISNLDTELQSNVENLKKMSLYQGDTSNNKDFESNIFAMLKNDFLIDLWSSVWPNVSEKNSHIAASIIANS
jgi:hypothetical protein